jgi:glycosyltransferase involved in cell wall biosynthesis
VLRHPENRGLGAAITTGFAHSTGDVVVVMDCDLSYAPGHIPLLVRALEAGSAQVAVASPYMPGGSTVNVPRHIERRSRLANRFIASASKIQLSTYTGVVRAYDGAFIRRLSVKHSDQRVNVEIVYKAHVLNARIIEVPATLDWSGLAHRGASLRNHDRRIRSATYRTVLDGVLFRPYLLFLAGGAALFALGLLLAAVPLAATGPAVHLGMVLIGAGVLLAMSSLLSIQVKRCFEELYFQQYTERAAVPHVAAPPVSPLYPVEIVRVGER